MGQSDEVLLLDRVLLLSGVLMLNRVLMLGSALLTLELLLKNSKMHFDPHPWVPACISAFCKGKFEDKKIGRRRTQNLEA